MSRASVPELNVDGCNVHFFEVLAQDGTKLSASGLSVRIPSTIYFDSGVPRMWFFNASDGVVRKRDAKSFTADDIWTSFTKLSRSSSIDDLVAVVLRVPPPSYEVVVPTTTLRSRGAGGYGEEDAAASSFTTSRYIDTRGLRTLLFGGNALAKQYPRRFMLQHFEQPQGWYNASIRVTWSPKVSFVEALRSPCSLRDVWKDEDERGATFESPNAIRTSLPAVAHETAKYLCGQVARHMEAVCDATVTGMLLYFKCNAKREMLLLCPGSLRLHPRRRQQTIPDMPSDGNHPLTSQLRYISPSTQHACGSVDVPSPHAAKLRVGGDVTVHEDDTRPLNIWHSMCSAAQLSQKRTQEALFAGKSVDEDLRALEKRLARVSPDLRRKTKSVSPAPKKHAPPSASALLPRTEALYVATARQLGIPIPACLSSVAGGMGSPHRGATGLTSWMTGSPSPPGDQMLQSEQKPLENKLSLSPPNPWQRRTQQRYAVGGFGSQRSPLSKRSRQHQPNARLLEPLMPAVLLSHDDASNSLRVSSPFSPIHSRAHVAPRTDVIHGPELCQHAGNRNAAAAAVVPLRRRSIPVVLSPVTQALTQAPGIVFPVPYMRMDSPPPATGIASPPATGIASPAAQPTALRDTLWSPSSRGSSVRGAFDGCTSPTGRQRRCNDACVALDDLLYLIRGTMQHHTSRAKTEQRSVSPTPSSSPGATFEYNADVLPPHVVARVLSPLGAQLIDGAQHGSTAKVAVLPASQQPRELFKAVQLCEHNIKQLQRKGWQTPPPSAPHVMETVPEQLEFLWEHQRTPSSVPTLAAGSAPLPTEGDEPTPPHLDTADRTHADGSTLLCGDPPPLPVLADVFDGL